jgi:hypothetical protein
MTDISNPTGANVRDAIRRLHDLPGDLEAEDDPAFTSEQVNFLEKRLYEVRALLEAHQRRAETNDVNYRVRQLLANHHSIAAIWCTDDVRGVRPHLSDGQAWEVLERVGDQHDAEWGINWTTLETAADDMFPNPERKRRKP